MINSLEFEVIGYFPKDFVNKKVNEPFIKQIMSVVLRRKNWERGDPVKHDPDYFCDKCGFEFTLASDDSKKDNLIQKLKFSSFSSEDIEKDAIDFIRNSIGKKAEKGYSVKNVHLCVLCLLDLFDWVSDEYGSYTQALTEDRKTKFFAELTERYIKTKVFNNIFIIAPDLYARWWVFDILTGEKCSVQVNIKKKNWPYLILKKEYDKIMNEKINAEMT